MSTQKPEVLFPIELLETRPTGPLYGYEQEETRIFNVLSCGTMPRHLPSFAAPVRLGYLGAPVKEPAEGPLSGAYTEQGVELQALSEPCTVHFYSLQQDVFSRNTGILETGIMLEKAVVISGCGSVGSLLALEMARAGVGSFLLLDHDVLSYSNVCRHQCGVVEVGRYKVNALRDRIWSINPQARVEALPLVIERVPKEVFDRWCRPGALVLGCADSREADVYANRVSCLYKLPFVSIGLWERAHAGEIFWSLPGETSCYRCMVGQGDNGLSQRVSANRRLYTHEEHLESATFEPGISVDIGFVTNVAAKIVLDLFRRDDPSYEPRVLQSLAQLTLVCNTNNPRLGGDMAEIFDHPLQVTRSIVVKKAEGCPHCRLAGA
jgi:molybdopterin/thiamine biosynthesis adenylyltransferase